MATPRPEYWYVWREFTVPEGETEPRLLIPFSHVDLGEGEHEDDELIIAIFKTAEEAQTWKEDVAPHEEWILCRERLEPLVGWKQCHECNEVKMHTLEQPVCMNCMEKTNGRGKTECAEDEAGQVRPGGT